MTKFVLFDRDGTIIEHVHHLSSLEEIVLVPELGETLSEIHSLGYKLAIVTNQSVIGRGMITTEGVNSIHAFISQEVKKSAGVSFDFIAFCTHLPEDKCYCRKPEIGLIQQKILDGKIIAAESFMVGDQFSDVEFGKRAGLRTVLIQKDPPCNDNPHNPDFIITKLSELPLIL